MSPDPPHVARSRAASPRADPGEADVIVVGAGLVTVMHRRVIDELLAHDGVVVGVRGSILAPSDAPRGAPSSRDVVGDLELRASAVIVTSGGIGGNPAQVRAQWPARRGTAPRHLLSGVPARVDGRLLGISEQTGARLINGDRMWHYPEGVRNWDPVWAAHGIRILPGSSSLWLDATGTRMPAPISSLRTPCPSCSRACAGSPPMPPWTSLRSSARSAPAAASSTTLLLRMPRSRRSARPGTTAATDSSASRPRTDCSTRTPGR